MPRPLLTETLSCFWLGTAGAVGAGMLAFRGAVFRADHPAFQCVTVGALIAGMLALVRRSRYLEGLSLILAFGLLGVGFSGDRPWRGAISAVLIAGGCFVVAVIYDEFAAYGIRFGKFLVVGPLLGGVLFALAPITEYHQMNMYSALRPLLLPLLLGIVIGDGAAFGVELAELLPWSARSAGGSAAPAGKQARVSPPDASAEAE